MRLVGAEAPWPWPSDIGPGDPFGFSWPLAVSLPTAPILGVGFRWISLDSLVINETYQWVTRKKRAKVFLGASAVAFAAPRWDSLVLACGSAELFMGKSYLSFGFYAIDYRLSLSFRPAQPSTHR